MADITREQYKAAKEIIEAYEAQEGTEEAIIKRVVNKGVRELVDFDWITEDRIRVKKLRYVLEEYVVVIENLFLHSIEEGNVYAKSNTIINLKIKGV